MKRTIFFALFLMMLTTACAQRKQMVIYRNGHSPLRMSIETVDSITFEDAQAEEHEFADLGLSVMWATCNIGAETPEQYGYYFAWGETSTKTSYTEENYSFCENGVYDTSMKTISGTERDAATILWQDLWRMPTITEVEELTSLCTWTWTSQNGVNGYKVTGPSGQSIFMPAAGQWRDKAVNVGSTGYYWTGTLSDDYPSAAYNLNFSGYNGRWSANRTYGFCIRAVCEK